MAAADAALDSAVDVGKLPKPPGYVDSRIRRGRTRLEELASGHNECYEFFRGNQYTYRNDENVLVAQATQTSITGGGKPAHRVRTTRNLIFDLVAHEVSSAMSRVPSYQVDPSTS